jgi:hypothetical protein
MKNNNWIVVLLVSITAVLASCDEPTDLKLKSNPEGWVIIEGQVTNVTGYQYVKVSRSSDFYASGKTPRITDATVTVTDDAGNTYPFVHNPENQKDAAGYYIPATKFTGVIGRTYSLRVVTTDGKIYTASDKLLPVTKMDSLGSRIDEDEQKDPKVEGRFYEALAYTHEPQDEENYYLFKFFRNDSLKFDNDTDIYYSNDEFLAENINGFDSPIFYSLGDSCKVEMYSITRTGYIYFNDLWNILNNDAGGMFGPVPARPRTNVSNGALGFFMVSALDISRTKIK